MKTMKTLLAVLLFAIILGGKISPSGYVRAPELFGTSAYYGTTSLSVVTNNWVTFVAIDGRFYQIWGEHIHDIHGYVPYFYDGKNWKIEFRGEVRKLCFAPQLEKLKCK